jgi:hypothetical protein
MKKHLEGMNIYREEFFSVKSLSDTNELIKDLK